MQVKQIFNYKGGSPQFTGYKPMNSLGYLSKAQVPEEDIVYEAETWRVLSSSKSSAI